MEWKPDDLKRIEEIKRKYRDLGMGFTIDINDMLNAEDWSVFDELVEESTVPELVELSILKWITVFGLVESGIHVEDNGDFTCAICKHFFYYPDDCGTCPVKSRTGRPGCQSTPYDEWQRRPSAQAAQKETLFLLGILREMEKDNE